MPFYFPLKIFLAKGFAFVVSMFSPCQGDGQLGQSLVIYIEHDRNNGETPFFDFDCQFFKLSFYEQEFPVAFGIMVIMGAHGIFGNVHVADKEFIAGKGTISISNGSFPVADRFYFRSCKLDTSRKFLHEEVFMGGPFILYGYLFLHLFLFGHQNNTDIIARVQEGLISCTEGFHGKGTHLLFKIHNGRNRSVIEV